ncbi:hypothetical protein [Marinoscillum sp. MHG1-6]|uniref:hypothetical protein n=1 Tax=Marinoscillum sp. MHG1-6 TaxID=2959627 RepID=UPI00215844CE|nr:hypothetical protein [Marinoscillum sp. MHG1-6]
MVFINPMKATIKRGLTFRAKKMPLPYSGDNQNVDDPKIIPLKKKSVNSKEAAIFNEPKHS